MVACFQVPISGRFWVSTEAPKAREFECGQVTRPVPSVLNSRKEGMTYEDVVGSVNSVTIAIEDSRDLGVPQNHRVGERRWKRLCIDFRSQRLQFTQ